MKTRRFLKEQINQTIIIKRRKIVGQISLSPTMVEARHLAKKKDKIMSEEM